MRQTAFRHNWRSRLEWLAMATVTALWLSLARFGIANIMQGLRGHELASVQMGLVGIVIFLCPLYAIVPLALNERAMPLFVL